MWKNLPSTSKNFILSFCITLLIIISFVALILADYRCSFMTMGISEPILSFDINSSQSFLYVNTLGIDKKFNITNCINYWQFFMEFICLKS